MTNQEILKKAIEKAVRNGWKPMGKLFAYVPNNKFWVEAFAKECKKEFGISGILFDKDFAKAFWGTWESSEEGLNDKNYADTLLERWQYHLQQLVLEEDPIKYLSNHV